MPSRKLQANIYHLLPEESTSKCVGDIGTLTTKIENTYALNGKLLLIDLSFQISKAHFFFEPSL